MRGIYVNRFIHQKLKGQDLTAFCRKSHSIFVTDYKPIAYDVLISDVVDEDLKRISRKIGTYYLSLATEVQPKFPVYGLIWILEIKIMFVNLVVKRGDKIKINVLFLVSPDSLGVYLIEDTLTALGYNDSLPHIINLNIYGTDDTPYRMSNGHFKNVNLLEQSYFSESRNSVYFNVFKKNIMI
jgi:hypothetical protein